MGLLRVYLESRKHKFALGSSFLLAVILILTFVRVMSADVNAALLSAEKTADRATIVPSINDTIQYTIVVSNTGDTVASNVIVTDTLAPNLSYVAGSLNAVGGTGTASENSGVISWAGSLNGSSVLTISFGVTVAGSAPVGQVLTNTAEITGTGTLLTPYATTEVVSPTVMYMPIVFKPFPQPALVMSRPNSANQWTATWNSVGAAVTGYELQESQDPNFGSLTGDSPGNVGLNTSKNFAHNISVQNVYYYRVRAVGSSVFGPWSNVVKVVGGYRDDFNDHSTGWAMRRTSYLEKTFAYYGGGNEAGQLVMLVDDRWDWLVASPLAPAPALPYSIQYQARVHDASNLVSGGMVFGGDWNNGACPDMGNVYQTSNCFNHFYNFNYIFYGPIKLLHEQVDSLAWCPTCGGSLLKRLGPTQTIDWVVSHSDSLKWHHYRVDVRADGARLYIDGNFVKHFPNTNWINEPYFGVFASTNEYKPSIWLYEYFQVTPLD